MDEFALVLKVVLALSVVLGLMWALARAARSRGVTRGVPLEIVSRAPLGKKSSVAILRVGDTRGLVVGVTDHAVNLLGEVELPAPAAAPEVRETITLATGTTDLGAPAAANTIVDRAEPAGALSGSILAPSTWKQAASALREKTVRQ